VGILLPKHIIPAAGRQAPHGYARQEFDDGRLIENDILTCAHCAFTWLFIPGSGRRRGTCKVCGGIVCGKPRCMAVCTPIEAQLAGEAPGALCDEPVAGMRPRATDLLFLD
jgi:hypothetical protein